MYEEDSEFKKHCHNLLDICHKDRLYEEIWRKRTGEPSKLNTSMNNLAQGFEELSVAQEQGQEDFEMSLT